MSGRPAVLYISYDGMLEPLGQSQVLAYLERLASDYTIHLVSFEKPDDWRQTDKRAALAGRIAGAGIAWHPLRYHKTPSVPATLFDIAHGVARALALVRRHRIALIHARSYVAALIGLQVKRLTGSKLLFDMRGFWADERVDGGLWPADGSLYRAVKRIEGSLLQGADAVVTLTHVSVPEIAGFDCLRRRDLPIHVIPTCADLDRFSPQPGIVPDVFTLGYLGSIGTWYLFEEVLACFALIRERRPDARLLVVNRNEQELVAELAAKHGIEHGRIEITAASHADVPQAIARMTVGAAIIKPVYSKLASAPTKLAEYLGCGVPCLGNIGVGDMEEILEGERTGVALAGLSEDTRRAGVERLLTLLEDEGLAARCRAVALERFSLALGVAEYQAIYREMFA